MKTIHSDKNAQVYLFENTDEPNHPSDGMVKAALRDYLSRVALDWKEPITLHWNKSDTSTYAVVAVSSKEVGVDIEYMKDRPFEKISRRYFHTFEITDDKEIFYDLWTRKEAWTKKKKGKIAENMKEFMYTPTASRRIEKYHGQFIPLMNLPDNVVGYLCI